MAGTDTSSHRRMCTVSHWQVLL